MTEAIQRIRNYMTRTVVTITPDLSVADAADRMRTNTIRHLPVVQQGKLVGLIAERDLALIDGLSERKRDKIQVRQLMRIHPFMCGPDDSLIDVVRVMIEHKLGSVIVVEQGVPVGVFTTIDAMRRLVELAQVMELMGSAD
ncbi:MAG: CBS domain-containing protein [Myxococcales bacterium]|nr:CBS domain-containing protein [Myxococcales bacterium]